MKNRRWFVWIPLLVVAIVLSVWEPEDSDANVVKARTRTPEGTSQRTTLQNTQLEKTENAQTLAALAPRELQKDFTGVFDAKRGTAVVERRESPPLPAAVVASAAPPQPAAPPLPLRFIGRMVKKGQPVLFLVWGDRNLAMHVGDVAEATYRLESIHDTQAEFTFLPLGVKQSLPLGGGA